MLAAARQELVHGVRRDAIARSFGSNADIDHRKLTGPDQAAHLLGSHAQPLRHFAGCEQASVCVRDCLAVWVHGANRNPVGSQNSAVHIPFSHTPAHGECLPADGKPTPPRHVEVLAEGGFPLIEEPTSECEMMNVEEAREIAKEKTEQLAQELERGQSETLKAYLAAMAKFPQYSPNNVWLILAQAPHARYVAGFGTWKRLGRYVRKGEHGIAILAPCVKRRRSDSGPAEPKRDKLAKRAESQADEVVVGFRGAYVWDVSQTEGAPVPEPACVDGDPGPYFDRLIQVIADRGIQFTYSPAIAPAHGVSTRRRIILRPDLAPAERFATAAHELGHVLLEHHKPNHSATTTTHHETEAEAVAYVVCQAIGLDSRSSSADYIQLWNGDTKTLAASLERIQRTAAEIITAIGPDV
jgi:antirestriction protein ArdC